MEEVKPFRNGLSFWDLQRRSQRKLWERGDPRVPEGWTPPAKYEQRGKPPRVRVQRGPWNQHLSDSQIKRFTKAATECFRRRYSRLEERDGLLSAIFVSEYRIVSPSHVVVQAETESS